MEAFQKLELLRGERVTPLAFLFKKSGDRLVLIASNRSAGPRNARRLGRWLGYVAEADKRRHVVQIERLSSTGTIRHFRCQCQPRCHSLGWTAARSGP